MRTRTKRELAVFAGIAVLLAVIVLANSAFQRGNLAERMDRYRRQVEASRKTEGLELLQWPLLRKTTGNMRRGPTFDERLIAMDNARVDIVGFMVPINQFRNMTEFLLLPVPIECYFCQAPPMRDVVVVQMAEGETTNLFREPVLVNGLLTLNHGPGTKFFYVISDARMGPGKKGGTLTQKDVAPQHMLHGQEQPEEELLDPMELPPPADLP